MQGFGISKILDRVFKNQTKRVLTSFLSRGYVKSNSPLILGIDQSTTTTKINIYDNKSNNVFSEMRPHRQITPHSGWLEHNPLEIIDNLQALIQSASKQMNFSQVKCIGVTNQRETVVAWNKHTGKPYHNAIVWSDGRTLNLVERFLEKNNNNKESFKHINGLPVSTYFTAFKIRWLLENVPSISQDIDNVLFGTIDSWVIWNLTKQHVTDVTNASRTFLMDLKNLSWSPELLDKFEISEKCLPRILSSCDDFGVVLDGPLKGIPITGCLGDQQAAALGHGLLEVGQAKNTYGTGSFLIVNVGNTITHVPGLISTVCFKLGNNQEATYALEGSIETGGNTINWLKDKMGIFSSFDELENLLKQVDDNGGVYFVPAFSGLYSPQWKETATGTIIGLTSYAERAHLARACIEAICYRTRDVMECIEKNSKIKIDYLNVDGGVTINEFFLQFQADVLRKPIVKPKIREATCFGATAAAGLQTGIFENVSQLKELLECHDQVDFNSKNEEEIERLYSKWKEAVQRSFDWSH